MISFIPSFVAFAVGATVGAATSRWAHGLPLAVVTIAWPCLNCVLAPVSSPAIEGESLLVGTAIGLGLSAGMCAARLLLPERTALGLGVLALALNFAPLKVGLDDLVEADRLQAGGITINHLDALRSALCHGPPASLPGDLPGALALLPIYDRGVGAGQDGWGELLIYERQGVGVEATATLGLSERAARQLPNLPPLRIPSDCAAPGLP